MYFIAERYLTFAPYTGSSTFVLVLTLLGYIYLQIVQLFSSYYFYFINEGS